MKQPNFFIIGAPKCGTTSLAAWLAEHPQIYMSPLKEPHHFNTDQNHVITPGLRHYEQLFEKANDRHLAVGEASVWYLYSSAAVPNIERYTTDAKYIVCLRDPVEMVYSLHEQLFVSGHECEPDFATSWHLQNDRVNGKLIPLLCSEPRFLLYGPVCSLGDQMERLYTQIPRKRVFPLLLDDIKADPHAAYCRVLEFLNIDDDERSEFSVHNPAKTLRAPGLKKVIQLLGSLKRSLGIRHGLGVLNAINRCNVRYRARAPMSIEMDYILKKYFREDVQKLSRLINRDLSHWIDGSQTHHTKKLNNKENKKC